MDKGGEGSGGRAPEAMDTDEVDDVGEGSARGGASTSALSHHSALQGLLKKLGAGLEDLLPTTGGSGSEGPHGLFGGPGGLFGGGSSLSHRLKPVLIGLKSFDDEQRQLGALTELCDVLTVSSEEVLVASFSCEAFLPPLVDLLRCEHNPDVALFAGRALTTLADLMPPRMAVAGMLRLGAADAFCAKLMCVEYIDVAEQSLQALEKITSAGEEHAGLCMRSGGVQAVLSFLDFFQTGVQRVAVKTAANMLACVSSKQDVVMIKDALPILVNLLSYGDDKIVEHAFLGLARALKAICSCMARSKQGDALRDEYTSTILSTKMLDEMSKLLQVSEYGSINSSLSTSSYYEAVRSLEKCCSESALLAERLLELDVPVTCMRLLQTSTMGSASSTGTTPMTSPKGVPTPSSTVSPMVSPSIRSTENTISILKLVDAMLPEVPENARALGVDSKQLSFSSSPVPTIQPDIVEGKACRVLLPTLFAMVSSTLAYQMKHVCLSCMKKLLVSTSSDGLKDMLRDLPASSTVVGLLASKDCAVRLDAIFMASVLLDKLPDIFIRYFMKEGVMFSVNRIVEEAEASGVPEFTLEDMVEEDAPTTSGLGLGRGRLGQSDAFVTPTSTLETKVLQAAKEFHSKYVKVSAEFGINSEALPEEMEALQKLAGKIESGDCGALSAFLDLVLAENGGLSSFELVHAGLEKALLAYFRGADGEVCYERMSKFAECFSVRGDSEDIFKMLLKRLHEIVSSREKLPVLACKSRPPQSSSMRYLFLERSQPSDRSNEANGFAALAHPFKLRFVRAQEEKKLRDYSSNVVLVEPLSTFEVIEDFLRTRVEPPQRSSDAFKARSRSSFGDDKQSSSKSSILTRSKMKQKKQEEEQQKKLSDDKPRRVTRSATKQMMSDGAAPEDDDDEEEEKYHSMDEEEMHGGSHMEDDHPDLEMEDEEDLDMLEDDMEDDMEDDDDEYDNPFRFRRDSEVHEVDVGESSSKAEGSRSDNYADKAASKSYNLQFFLNGKLMSAQSSIFQAVLRANDAFVNADDPENSQHGPSVWERVHTFTYKRQVASSATEPDANPARGEQSGSQIVSVKDLVGKSISGSNGGLVEALDKDTLGALDLINILVWLQGNHSRAYEGSSRFLFLNGVSQEDLISPRLTSKVSRQLQDLLIICGKCLPPWVHSVVTNYPMVFPFDLRRQYLHLTFLGVPHAIQYLLQQIPNGDSLRQELRDVRLVRNKRQKVRIYRDKLLDSACKVMELYGKSRASLEVEYHGEVGTGLGPTLEFYTLLSSELQRRTLNIWLTADKKSEPAMPNNEVDMEVSGQESSDMESEGLIFGEMDSVSNPVRRRETLPSDKSKKADANEFVEPLGDGLFPVPKSKVGKRELAYFRLLGTAFAKALYDGRLLDISLSTAFWRRALGEDLSIYDLACVDGQMSKSLTKLYEAAHSDSEPGKMDGVPIEDLGLYFTLPGHDGYELCPNGADRLVTGKNVRDFLDKVLDAYFGSGTAKQFSKFRDGFEEVFPLEKLAIFKTDEIDTLFCGQTEKWTVEMLSDCLKFDHGYTATSPYIKQFLHILADFDSEEQRQFLKFVTGAPRLPPGGLSALNPKLTIVRKNFSSARDSAGNTPRSEGMHTPVNELVLENYDLPSVMTCANYVKLPPYTSQAVMREKLMYAMKEGQHSFNLS
ncbi:E3 ubiquitin-protein ligase [Chloropicon primus]|uniref:HECT-type E3 ubiquitin transferase n=1 Tax=Chloropicon primus TaxID=1764295 RepID=A0A5B8MRL5_9CHLO|nr:E3 ubiquitin-protein ligase [Chloropicon primus]|eukprot:QDZ23116.1 E3 ubiquitin-protein ligase [Chloropicon primus]